MRNPLMAFSPGTVLQVQILRAKGEEILSLMDESVKFVKEEGHIRGEYVDKAHGLFWLWVLGAYEVLRTMAAAPECFSEDLHARIKAEKKYYSKIRMPFAKQEYQGKKIPTWKSSYAMGVSGRDGDITFDIAGELLSARESVTRFRSFVASIKADEVIMGHLARYGA